ncbi:MAG TPA: hypothetical protein VE046_12490 [Steroidobacteraceae bacterium]|nr:hypothetical protein [Steroidobacteraceae bacterium]
MRVPAAILAVWLAAPAVAAADDDVQALDAAFGACLANPALARYDNDRVVRSKPQTEPAKRQTGSQRPAHKAPPPGLALVCPELVSAVARSDFGSLVPADWDDVISARRVRELRTALGASRESPATRSPTLETLRPVLGRIESRQKTTPPTPWEQFKSWLKSIFERRDKLDQGDGWFSRLLRNLHVSPIASKIINYSLLALLLAGAVAVVVIELRAAGVLARTKPGVAARRRAVGGGLASFVTLGDVAAAPLAERPALMLQLLIGRFVSTGRLQERRSFTHRELDRATRLDEASDREAFREVLIAAEAVRYADQAPEAERLDRVVRDGEALLLRIPDAGGSTR